MESIQPARAHTGVTALGEAAAAAVVGGEDICVAVPAPSGRPVVLCGSVLLVMIAISILS